MKHITTADALRALEEAVAEKGADYQYEKVVRDGIGLCAYLNDDGSPSCIAGNALLRLGVPVEDLRRYNTGNGVSVLAGYLDLSIDPSALGALATAQFYQDQGAPWGEAAARARGAVFDA